MLSDNGLLIVDNDIDHREYSNRDDITMVILGNNCKKIGSSAFRGCKNLKQIYLGGTEDIGLNAFDECSSLTTVVMTNNVDIVRSYAFQFCNNLTYVFGAPEDINDRVSIIGNRCLTKCLN